MNPLHKHKMLSVGYQVKQNLKSGDMENLNSLLEFWESVKNDTATCVTLIPILLQFCSRKAFFFKKKERASWPWWSLQVEGGGQWQRQAGHTMRHCPTASLVSSRTSIRCGSSLQSRPLSSRSRVRLCCYCYLTKQLDDVHSQRPRARAYFCACVCAHSTLHTQGQTALQAHVAKACWQSKGVKSWNMCRVTRGRVGSCVECVRESFACARVCVFANVHACVCAYVRVCVSACVCACACVCLCAYCACVRVRAYVHMCVCACVHVCVCVRVCVCARVFTCVLAHVCE